MLLRGWKRFPMTGDRKCYPPIFKNDKKNHLRGYRLIKGDLVPERIIECALSEAVSAYMKENKVLRNCSMDLLRASHAQ